MNNNIKIIFLKGIPSSGKSTWVNKHIEEIGNCAMLSRDNIKNSIWHKSFPYYKEGSAKLREREKIVVEIFNIQLERLIQNGYNIIVDCTNINPKYLRNNLKTMKKMGLKYQKSIEFSYIDFTHIPVETCIEWDKSRIGYDKVTEEVIKLFDNNLKKWDKMWHLTWDLYTNDDENAEKIWNKEWQLLKNAS